MKLEILEPNLKWILSELISFYFHTSLWCLKRFHNTFWDTTKKCENKKFKLVFCLRPGSGREGLTHFSPVIKPATHRFSYLEVFYQRTVLKNLERNTGKHPHRIVIFEKKIIIKYFTLLKKTLLHRCFPTNLVNFF